MKEELNKRKIFEMVESHQITPDEAFHLIKKLKQQRLNTVDSIAKPETPIMMYFQNVWEKSELEAKSFNKDQSGHILIFDTNEDFYNIIIKFLEEEVNNIQAVLVKPGKNFQYLGNNIYEIDPERQTDYRQLLEALNTQNLIPGRIIHMWSRDSFVSNEEVLNTQLKRGFYSLFYLSQILMEQKPKDKIYLLYIYSSSKSKQQPQYAAVSGFSRTIRMENPKFIYKTVEVSDLLESHSDMALPQLLDKLLREFKIENITKTEIRYEEDQRFVKVQNEIDRASETEKGLELKENGVYLLTGGAGGLGLIFAEYLVKQVKTKIILTGRSDLSFNKEKKIQELRSFGSEILYIKADISKKDDVEVLVAEIKSRFKAINGVIHSAGVNRDSFILKKTREEMETVLAPKVYGTVFLDDVLKDEKLDFFVLFSSIAAVIGNVGQSGYAYGNSFLDIFAEMRERLRSGHKRFGKTFSVNWPLWQSGGMGVDEQATGEMKNVIGMTPLSNENGIKAFEDGFKFSIPQLVVIEGIEGKIKKTLNIDYSEESIESDEDKAGLQLKITDKVKSQLQEKSEVYIKRLLAQEAKLPVEEIYSNEPFEHYGIDSVMIMNLNRKLENIFGELSKTLFFEYQTIAELVEYFIENHQDTLVEKLKSFLDVESEETERVLLPGEELDMQLVSLGQSHISREKDIAIIGLSGRFPMANNIDEFWENLKKGKDCIVEIPKERWDYRDYYDSDPMESSKGKMYCKWGGFIDDVDKFDPLFFSISPREAETMDPQERIFLQTVWEALEDAGYTRKRLREYIEKENISDIGVFAGSTTYSYQLLGPEEWSKGNMAMPNSTPWSIANRVSYTLDFRGPSMPVDTACSSSLTAIHLACDSIKKGECHLAIAGGVNFYLHYSKYIGLCQLRMLSPKGRCHSFGSEADGFVPGEGVGIVLLKSLTAAIKDRDHIYAIVKGSSVNHGGKTTGYTVPNPNAQAELVLQALKSSNINPKTISYVEAHGTGTQLGDPIEISGLTKAFREYTNDTQFCSIGSSKSNIGHLEAAAGITGILKMILQMKYKKLVPSIHSSKVNPNINFKDSPFFIQQKLEEWKLPVIEENGKMKSYPRRAAISSFGAGGTNAHVILEEYEAPDQKTLVEEKTPRIILLSARNEERLKAYAEKMADFLKRAASSGTLIEVPEENLLQKIQEDLLKVASEIIKVDKQEIDLDEDLKGYGFDGITLLEFVNKINKKYNKQIESSIFSEYYSVGAVANYICGMSEESLDKKVEVNKRESNLVISNIAYTLQVGREEMDQRLAIVVSSIEDLIEKLIEYGQGKTEVENLYRGKIEKKKMDLDLIVDGEEGREFVKKLINNGELGKLAKLWVSGVEIEWELLFSTLKPNRISLPTYPFSQESYWIEKFDKIVTVIPGQEQVAILHPLIDSNESTYGEVCFKKVFKEDEFYIRDREVLTGLDYLEMARVAGTLANRKRKVKKIKNIRWSWKKTTIPSKSSKDVYIHLLSDETDNDKVKYRVDISGKNNERIVHSRGELYYKDNDGSQVVEEEIEDIKAIIARCYDQNSGDDCYKKFEELGLKYGESFKIIQESFSSKNEPEALFLLELPLNFQEGFKEFLLHPLFMEGTLQTILWIIIWKKRITKPIVPILPTNLGEVNLGKIDALLGHRCYIHTKLSGDGSPKRFSETPFEVKLIDEGGQVLVRMTDLFVRRL